MGIASWVSAMPLIWTKWVLRTATLQQVQQREQCSQHRDVKRTWNGFRCIWNRLECTWSSGDSEKQENFSQKLAGIGKNRYICSRKRVKNLPIDKNDGLHEWGHINGYLTDTCLTAQDQYKALLEYFKVSGNSPFWSSEWILKGI